MKKRQILVELTPLLDVILIMLFVLLVQSKTQVQAAEVDRDEAESESAVLKVELESVKNALEEAKRRERTLGIVDEKSAIVTVSVIESSPRRILIESDGGTVTYVSLDSGRSDTARERFIGALRSIIEEGGTESAFLVFQYDRNGIYNSEYELIKDAVLELKPELLRGGIYINYAEIDLILDAFPYPGGMMTAAKADTPWR